MKRLNMHVRIGEGNSNPLQCSCLGNPRDGGAWWAAVYGVAQSRTRLKRLSSIQYNGLKYVCKISLICSLVMEKATTGRNFKRNNKLIIHSQKLIELWGVIARSIILTSLLEPINIADKTISRDMKSHSSVHLLSRV